MTTDDVPHDSLSTESQQGIGDALNLLRQRNFALLWFGQFISVLGDWFLYIGLPVVVYERTGSALAAGGLFIVETIPSLVLGSIAGVFVDRWDRRKTMYVADALRALLLIPLLFAWQDGWLWLVYPVMFLNGSISQFFYPARSAILPSLVEEEDMAQANGLIKLGEEIGAALGSVAGGLFLAAIGLQALVAIDFATYLVSALAIALVVAPSGHPEQSGETVESVAENLWSLLIGDWLAGLRIVLKDRLVTSIFAITAIAMIGEGIIAVLLVVFVEDVLGGGPEEFGWINGARGIGTIIAGLVVGAVASRISVSRMIVLSGLASGFLLFGFFNTNYFPMVLLFSGLAGLTVVPFYVGQQTLLQLGVSDDFLGRIFGAYETTQGAALLLGLGIASLVTETLGVAFLLNTAAALVLVSATVALYAWQRGSLATMVADPQPSAA